MSMFVLLKKTSLALTMAERRAAMMVEVRIATSMEPDRSPITTIGGSNGRLQHNSK